VSKVKVEFINTCSCCEEYGRIIRSVASGHGDKVEVKIYIAGKDFDYLKKYGPVTRGTMIINGEKRLDTLSREIIEKAITDALSRSGD